MPRACSALFFGLLTPLPKKEKLGLTQTLKGRPFRKTDLIRASLRVSARTNQLLHHSWQHFSRLAQHHLVEEGDDWPAPPGRCKWLVARLIRAMRTKLAAGSTTPEVPTVSSTVQIRSCSKMRSMENGTSPNQQICGRSRAPHCGQVGISARDR